MKYRVLAAENIPGNHLDRLAKLFETDIGPPGQFTHENALLEVIEKYDALIPLVNSPVSKAVLNKGKNLKVVANFGVGYNNIDIETAKKLGITVTNTPDVLTEATAELALALIFATARHLPAAELFLRNGRFTAWMPTGFLGASIQHSVLGIIGMGKIGQELARMANAIGMHIIYHNRNRLDSKTEARLEATCMETVEDLIRESDFISLNCPLTPQTRHLINIDRLALMKSNAILINTARGEIVDEAALAEALHNNQIGGAGIDVFENEPEIHPRLLSAPKALLLPHIGSATERARCSMARLAVDAVIHVLQGKNSKDLKNFIC